MLKQWICLHNLLIIYLINFSFWLLPSPDLNIRTTVLITGSLFLIPLMITNNTFSNIIIINN